MGLTDLHVRKLTPRETRFEVLDGKGLYIRVTPNGTKTWIFRYQFNGTPRRLTLGTYPGVGLADARVKHGEAMQSLQKGIDPGVVAQEEKARFKAVPTVKDMLLELWETEIRHKRSGPETRRLLEKDMLPAWGNRRVTDIKRRDIALLLDGIAKRGAPITRNRVHSALTRFFNFSAERGVIADSPCTRIRKLAEKNKSRVLTNDELRLLWNGLDLANESIDIFWTTKLALRLLILTGQRPGEVCGMTWKEVDLERGTWSIPPARMKNNCGHILPLTAASREIILRSRSLFGDDTYVFPSPRRGQGLTPHALSRAMLRHRGEMQIADPFTPHDIRRTVRTRFAELKVDEFIAERTLGHKLQGMLAVYNQHDYLPEKRQALELWERKLEDIVGGDTFTGNVVAIRGRRNG